LLNQKKEKQLRRLEGKLPQNQKKGSDDDDDGDNEGLLGFSLHSNDDDVSTLMGIPARSSFAIAIPSKRMKKKTTKIRKKLANDSDDTDDDDLLGLSSQSKYGKREGESNTDDEDLLGVKVTKKKVKKKKTTRTTTKNGSLPLLGMVASKKGSNDDTNFMCLCMNVKYGIKLQLI